MFSTYVKLSMFIYFEVAFAYLGRHTRWRITIPVDLWGTHTNTQSVSNVIEN